MKIMIARYLTLTLLYLISFHALAQNCKVDAKFLGPRNIEGMATYYVPKGIDSLRFHLVPNGYAGKNTLLADSLFKHFSVCLYFAKENELGGYTDIKWSDGSSEISGNYNETKEHFSVKVPESRILECNFKLKLPARCQNFGFDDKYIYLEKWLPSPLGLSSWSYLLTFHITDPKKLISSHLMEEKSTDSGKRFTLVSVGDQPSMILTDRELIPSTKKDNKGREYEVYSPIKSKPLSPSKSARYMRSVGLNFKDSLVEKRIVIDDGKYARLPNLLLFSHKAIKSPPRSFLPSFRYTANGNFMVGFLLNNLNKNKQLLYYYVNPLFSITNDFNWSAGMMKPLRVRMGAISQITPQLTYRKFHYYTNRIDDYTLDYHRISPRLKFTLKNHRWINLEYAYINEEIALYEGRKINFDHRSSQLYRLYYDQEKKSPLYQWKFSTHLEHFRYQNIFSENQQFLKISADFRQAWRLSMFRDFSVRLFAAKFLTNDQRTSTNYSDFITKGSIALIHQGRNDYAYDELFVARKNQNVFLENQIGSQGGGFKNAPSTKSSLGLSNDFAAGINLRYDVLRLKKSFLFFLYADGGLYRQYSNAKWATKNIYSAGLGLTVSDAISLYLPVLNHKDINTNYRDNNLGFFERWSFQLYFKEKFESRK